VCSSSGTSGCQSQANGTGADVVEFGYGTNLLVKNLAAPVCQIDYRCFVEYDNVLAFSPFKNVPLIFLSM
jgi:hypothetical protein